MTDDLYAFDAEGVAKINALLGRRPSQRSGRSPLPGPMPTYFIDTGPFAVTAASSSGKPGSGVGQVVQVTVSSSSGAGITTMTSTQPIQIINPSTNTVIGRFGVIREPFSGAYMPTGFPVFPKFYTGTIASSTAALSGIGLTTSTGSIGLLTPGAGSMKLPNGLLATGIKTDAGVALLCYDSLIRMAALTTDVDGTGSGTIPGFGGSQTINDPSGGGGFSGSSRPVFWDTVVGQWVLIGQGCG